MRVSAPRDTAGGRACGRRHACGSHICPLSLSVLSAAGSDSIYAIMRCMSTPPCHWPAGRGRRCVRNGRGRKYFSTALDVFPCLLISFSTRFPQEAWYEHCVYSQSLVCSPRGHAPQRARARRHRPFLQQFL